MRKKAIIIATIILSLGIVGFVWAAPGDSWEINPSGDLTTTTSIDIVSLNNNTEDLGVFGNAWKNLFVSSTAFLDDVQVGAGSGDAFLNVYEAPADASRMIHFGPDDSEFSASVKSNYLDITNSVIGYYNNLEAGTGVYNGLSVVAENDNAGDIYGFQSFSVNAISSHASGNKGLVSSAFFQTMHSGAGTVSALTDIASYPRSTAGSGTVTDVKGLQVSPALLGTTTNLYRVKIEEGGSAGTITNSYGLYIDELSGNGDVLNYSIYVDGPKDENFPFVVEADGNVGIGTAFPSSALQILEGDFEVGSGSVTTTLYQNGSASFGGDITLGVSPTINNTSGGLTIDTTGNTVLLPDAEQLRFGTGSDASLFYASTQSPFTLFMGVGQDSRSLIFAERLDSSFDFAHAQQTNPTLFMQSANQSEDEWLSLAHDQTDGVIEVGEGNIVVKASALVGDNGASNDTMDLGQFGKAWEDVYVSSTSFLGGTVGADPLVVGSGTSKFIVKDSGKVGIGIDTPQRQLHVSGGSDVYSDIIFNNSSIGETSTDGLQVGYIAGDAYIWNYEASKIIVATNNSVRANIMSDGLFIIGNSILDGTLATSVGDVLINSNLEVDSTSLFQGLTQVCNGTCGTKSYGTTAGELYVENDIETDGLLAVADNIYVGVESSSDDDYIFFDANTENIWWDESENRFKISDALIPSGGHKASGYDLGKSGQAWDNLYYDDAFNQGAPDWSQANVLDKLRAFKPAPKAPGTFDARKEEAGVSELNPGSLPIELTGYHQQKAEYDNWTPFEKGADGKFVMDEEGNKIYNGDRPTNPNTRPEEELGIWTNGMVSFNYQAIGEILEMVDELKLENQNLIERIEKLENM